MYDDQWQGSTAAATRPRTGASTCSAGRPGFTRTAPLGSGGLVVYNDHEPERATCTACDTDRDTPTN